MLFNSFNFILFLSITFTLYYFPLLFKKQVHILIVASLFFYAYGEPALLCLLLFSAFINVFVSYSLVYGNKSLRKFYATAGVILNLSLLIFFKYSTLFADTFLDTSQGIGHFLILIPLPIGISFYSFEGITILLDVYSNKHSDVLTIEKSFKNHLAKTLFFISFFPHLISGPILKAYEFYPQIGQKKFADIDWQYVFKTLTTGYFLKMVVADNLTNFTSLMAYPFFKVLSSLNLVVMVFGYSFQIFADFAGYSLIALGLAKLFGYNLIENFNFPYISTSFSEFWRRWHISLSTFLKEYLYIPLGGNKKGRLRTYFNLIITMGLGGLWHGAAWSYAIWGLFHGLALAIERLTRRKVLAAKKTVLIQSLNAGIVFLFVTLAWILFKLPFNRVIEYFQSIWTNRHFAGNYTLILEILLYSSPVIFYHIFYLLPGSFKTTNTYKKFKYAGYGFLLFMILVNSGPSGSFIYFQF